MKISVIFGTRPEAIKLAPVVLALRNHPDLQGHICVTGQHREMLDQVLELFEITPDEDFQLMRPNQTLGGLTSRLMEALDQYLTREKPDLVIMQGDTTTAFCAALAAFYHHIPVGHVEAGLRTGNMLSPWPEEANRVLASRLATLHFAPTTLNEENLRKEGIEKGVHVTGNTVVDALFIALEKAKKNNAALQIPELIPFFEGAQKDRRMVLITGHRRENFGGGFENICKAIAQLAKEFPETDFVYPVHLNPRVREPVMRILGDGTEVPPENVFLIEPLSYLPFVALMNRSTLILTDSGGIQEEAPSLGKPVLVMRDTTERPEAVHAGTVKLVGTDTNTIIQEARILLSDSEAYERMSHSHNPYGDGDSSNRILEISHRFLHSKKEA